MRFRIIILFTLIGIFLFGSNFGRRAWLPVVNKLKDKKSVSDVVSLYGADVEKRLIPIFDKSGIPYPPAELAFLVVKEDKVLEVWAKDEKTNWQLIFGYPVLAASGVLGPKLREGDHQVPEGIYKLEYLNPNNAFHLSMKINYPNEFDLKWAQAEGRSEPGSDIFIHGEDVSVGCLAMGNETIQELFILTESVGKENVSVVISPVDPRNKSLAVPEGGEAWIKNLYENIKVRFLAICKE